MTGKHEKRVQKLFTDFDIDTMMGYVQRLMDDMPTEAQVDSYQRYLGDIAPGAAETLEHVLDNITDADFETARQMRRAALITMTAFVGSIIQDAREHDADPEFYEGRKISED